MSDALQWNVPGWDWDEGDYAWLSSESGIQTPDGTSIFFIHGGRIRHQSHIPTGNYSIEQFCQLLRDRASGLDDPTVVWSEDTGGGDCGLWVEGTRAPAAEDVARLQAARDHQAYSDRSATHAMRQRHPEWFSDAAPRWDAVARVWVNDPCAAPESAKQEER